MPVYRRLNAEDETVFKKLQAVESKLSQKMQNGSLFVETLTPRAWRTFLVKERNFGPGTEAKKIHALRYLLIQLLLQVLLHPNEFSKAASELVICCKKSFPVISNGDSSKEEDEFNDNGKPLPMDVIVDTLLSLLPQSFSALRFAVEQVFKVICDYITDDGLLQMLRIVKKDLKPARHQVDGNDNDDNLLKIEDVEETYEVEQRKQTKWRLVKQLITMTMEMLPREWMELMQLERNLPRMMKQILRNWMVMRNQILKLPKQMKVC